MASGGPEPLHRAPRFVLNDEHGRPVAVPPDGEPSVLVFYRGDWCPYCNGQLAAYARDAQSFAGAAVYGISVDPPERNAAMVEKLVLPFPLLADPDAVAIEAYGLLDVEQGISRPAIVVVDAHGVVTYAYAGEDFSDRPGDNEVLASLAPASSS